MVKYTTDYRDDNKWTVYIHINKLNNKKYIGITSTNVWKRWGTNGIHYKPYDGTRCRFWNAINKYGFDNFEHEIIAEHLTKHEACDMERLLIKKLKTTDDRYGYNILFGGDGVDGHKPSKGVNHCLSKQIYQYDLNYNLLKTWESLSEVTKNIDECKVWFIKKACNEKRIYLDSFWSYNLLENIDYKNLIHEDIIYKSFIFKYDLNGNCIDVFDDFDEVLTKNTDYVLHSLRNAYNKITTSYKGFIWSCTSDADYIRFLLEQNMIAHKSEYVPVCQFDLNGTLINRFSSSNEAEKLTGFKANKIFDNCMNRIKTSKGYVWKFDKDYFNRLELNSSFLL